MKRAWGILEFLFACVAMLLVCLFCAYAWPENSFGLAAWVQAIGSIGAIFVAIGILWAQNDTAAKVLRAGERNANQRRLTALKAVVNDAYGEAVRITMLYPDPESAKWICISLGKYRDFDRYLRTLQAIPLHEIGSGTLILGIQLLIQWMQTMQHEMAELLADDSLVEYKDAEYVNELQVGVHQMNAKLHAGFLELESQI